MAKRVKLVGGLLALLALVVISYQFPVRLWMEELIQWVRNAGVYGALVLGLVYIVGTVAFFPGSIITMTLGFLYGPIGGILIASPASVIGASLAFLVGRFLARDWVEQAVAKDPRFQRIDQMIGQKAFRLILLLRLSPLFPFNLLNYGLGITQARFSSYVLASLIGMLPGTLMYVYFGSLVTTLSEIFSGQAVPNATGKYILYGIGFIATVVITVWVTRMAKQALRLELPRE